MTQAVLQTKDDRIAISGELIFDSVPVLWQEIQSMLNSASTTIEVVDLVAVKRADSAGVAMLVAWLGLARRLGHSVRFINTPEQIRILVRVTGLSELLSLDASTVNPL